MEAELVVGSTRLELLAMEQAKSYLHICIDKEMKLDTRKCVLELYTDDKCEHSQEIKMRSEMKMNLVHLKKIKKGRWDFKFDVEFVKVQCSEFQGIFDKFSEEEGMASAIHLLSHDFKALKDPQIWLTEIENAIRNGILTATSEHLKILGTIGIGILLNEHDHLKLKNIKKVFSHFVRQTPQELRDTLSAY